MTCFGPDISSYQSGLVLSRLADAAFVIAKTTEGTYYTDADYQAWRGQAAQLGKPFVWYHFLSGEAAAAQAAHTAANVGDKGLVGMLDFEPAGSFNPTLAQAVAYIKAAQAVGLRLLLVYLPHWYWQQLGGPDLSELAALGVHLVSSAYPGGTGSPTSIYPGDGAAGWQSYGGMTPLLYQFTNQASDGGQPLDYNAFRGTVAELQTILGGDDMALTQADADLLVNAALAKLPAAIAKATYEYGEETVNDGGVVIKNTPLGNMVHGCYEALNNPAGAVPQMRSQVNDLHKQPPPTVVQITAAVQTAVQGAVSAGLVTEQAGAQIAQQVVAHLTLTVGAK